MPPEIFPESLPGLAYDQYRYKDGSQTTVFVSDLGSSVVRQDWVGVREYRLTWIFDDAQLKTFIDWFRNENKGAYFTLSLRDGDAIGEIDKYNEELFTDKSVRFTSELFRISSVAPTFWRLEATAEEELV